MSWMKQPQIQLLELLTSCLMYVMDPYRTRLLPCQGAKSSVCIVCLCVCLMMAWPFITPNESKNIDGILCFNYVIILCLATHVCGDVDFGFHPSIYLNVFLLCIHLKVIIPIYDQTSISVQQNICMLNLSKQQKLNLHLIPSSKSLGFPTCWDFSSRLRGEPLSGINHGPWQLPSAMDLHHGSASARSWVAMTSLTASWASSLDWGINTPLPAARPLAFTTNSRPARYSS